MMETSQFILLSIQRTPMLPLLAMSSGAAKRTSSIPILDVSLFALFVLYSP